MKKDIAIFGLGIFGEMIVSQFSEQGSYGILVVDIDEKKVEKVKDKVSEAIVADVTDEDVIRELDVSRFDMILLAMGGKLENLIICTTLLKNENAHKVIVKVNSDLHKQIMLRCGADEVIQPEKEFAEIFARKYLLPSISDIYPFGNGFLANVMVPARMVGHTLKDLDLRKKYGISVILIKKKNDEYRIIWNPDTVLEDGDELAVIGEKDTLTDVFKD